MRRAAWVTFVFLFAHAASACTYTVEELERIAASEGIAEISQASGLALVDTYVATKPEVELEQLARSTCIGIAYAATMSLRALDDPVASLVSLSPQQLWEQSRTAATPAERLDAASAYFLTIRTAATRESLEQEAASDECAEWALAAGEMLGGFYAAYDILSLDDLVDRAAHDPRPGMRRAASIALSALWTADGLALTDGETEAKIVELMQWKPDLAAAYIGVLARRFMTGLGKA
jgi:hypothetical protein